MAAAGGGAAGGGGGGEESWRANLVRDDAGVRALAASAKRVAVLGVAPEAKADRPTHFVARYLRDAGVSVVPVPVYFPEVTEILGEKVYRRVADVPGELDIVCVFRKPEDVPGHLDDLLAAKSKAVWLQEGISHAPTEEALARAGVRVVSDRCLKVEHQLAGGSSGSRL